MAKEFVRYSPDIERDDPNFDRALQTVLEGTRRYVTESVATEGRAVRDAHAQGHGLAKGEVEILGGLPKAYAQGIYAKAARHEALVRFSNGTARLGPDAWLGTASGIGLKILGIDEPTLLEDEPDGRTFDYVMINGPVFFVNTVEHYIFLQKLLFQLGLAPPLNETPEQ